MSIPTPLHRLRAPIRLHTFTQAPLCLSPSLQLRQCSCTAQLRREDSPTTTSQASPQPKLNTTTEKPPKPPADHRDLAAQQGLFITSKYSPGSPLLPPNGAHMFNKLQNFLRTQYGRYGFREVITPTMYKRSLWEKSGHWDKYAQDMYEVRGRGATGAKEDAEIGEDEEFGLKPMNCPGHCLLFAAEKRSYRDLPIRYADFSALHRNEVSGALSGLTRVRRFHQDDGHIFCRPSQIGAEISATLQLVAEVYNTFSLGPYKLVLSTRPSNYIGTVEEWDRAEDQLRQALDASGLEWGLNEGDGAFYGPKIDIILTDHEGKEHQTATIQLDFQLPQRFSLSYTAPSPNLERTGSTSPSTDPPLLEEATGPAVPVLIHRAVLGSIERFMALLISHYNGTYPLWLSPLPGIILTVNTDASVLAYAEEARQYISYNATLPPPQQDAQKNDAQQRLARAQQPSAYTMPPGHVHDPASAQYHIALDASARPLGKKVFEAKKKGYAVVMVVGGDNVGSRTVGLEFANLPQRSSDAVARQAALELKWAKAAGGNDAALSRFPLKLARRVFSKAERLRY